MNPLLTFLAQTEPVASKWDMITAVGVMLGVMVNCFVLLRMASGKDGERQVEPTAQAAVIGELRGHTALLNKLDREMGELKTNIGAVNDKLAFSIAAVDDKISAQAGHVEGAFKRINAISTESAALKGRFDDFIASCRDKHPHA
jgi:hypothetical protein